MSGDMSCFVCAEAFSDATGRSPKLLPCLHGACASCVAEMARTAAEAGRAQPVCRECAEPFVMDAILDDTTVQRTTTTTTTTPTTTTASLSSASTTCSQHSAAEVCAFCSNCETLVCLGCITGTHQGHAFVSVADADARTQTALQADLAVLLERRAAADGADEAFADVEAVLAVRLADVTASIDAAFNPILEQLQKRMADLAVRRDELKARARTDFTADIKTTQLQRDGLDHYKERVRVAAQQAAGTASSNTTMPASERIVRAQLVRRRVQALTAAPLDAQPSVTQQVQFTFFPVANVVTAPLSAFGTLYRGRDLTTIGQPLLVFGSFGADFGKLDYPFGIAQLADGNLAVSDSHNRRVQIFTMAGEYVRSTALTHMPAHVAAVPSGGFMVVSGNALDVFSRDYQPVRSQIIKVPTGVAITPDDGTVIIACSERRCVEAYTPEGVLRWMSSGSGLGNVHAVMVTSTGEVFVSDYRNGRIQVLSLATGAFVRMLGQGQLTMPGGLAELPFTGKFVVVEREGCSIWTLDGDLVHRWGSKGDQPGQFKAGLSAGVAVLRDGRIAVTDTGNHRVQLF